VYSLLRQLLFLLPAETSHQVSLHAMDLAARLGLSGHLLTSPAPNPQQLMGIEFPNPVGLAAGLDKNADHLAGLAALGFGFIEVGTVTPRPQPGNPKPRLFRIPEKQAIINRMGFNNLGVDHLLGKVKAANYSGVLGINIGKNFDTPVENAADDYRICLRKVYAHASYITVNMSSPNTPGLRDLQFGEPLKRLLASLKAEQQKLQAEYRQYVPMVVKIAPDMADDDIREVAAALIEFELDGVIATNTTISRDGVKGLMHAEQAGGLSGAPLREKSTEVIHKFAQALGGKLPIIGVGGILSGQDGADKILAGASLVQLYSGFIYRGPELIRDVNQSIADMKRPA
jgi:dihydroorotate dehydrogenase